MTRGYSLVQDLILLMNNPKYSDIEILCEDEEKLYGCRAILASRSEVFDKLLYNGTNEKQISFPKISTFGMKIVLEYIHTGAIKNESLNKDNIVEAFHAADHFQLSYLQNSLMKTVKNSFVENYSPELFSKVVDTMSLSNNNILLNLLVEAVAIMPLNTIEFGRLSTTALQYLLSYTYEKEKPFATPEYEVFRYSTILAAKKVSNDAYVILMERLPPLENSIGVKNIFITDHQEVARELEPLVKYIDFWRIETQTLAEIIEPLKIIPAETITSAYKRKALSKNLNSSNIRGIPLYKLSESDHVWDESTRGSKLIIEENGKIICAPIHCNKQQCARAKMALEDKGIFEWDIIIEKLGINTWVGVCASKNFNYENWAGGQPTGWVLGTDGSFSDYFSKTKRTYNYCPRFGDGAKITVHLDMNKKTCAFTVNGTKYPEVPAWNNLPSNLYPVVSLVYPGRLRIQPYRKV